MKIKGVKIILKKFICWILLLQMINISIDPPDVKFFKNADVMHREDLSINEIESIYELISEVFLNRYVHESDENDINGISKTFNIYFFAPASVQFYTPAFSIGYCSYYQNIFSVLFSKPISPPPKQVEFFPIPVSLFKTVID